MAFTEGTPYIGGMSRFLLMGMGIDSVNDLAKTIPESVYMCFQMTFAIITPALICGSFADRMKFSALMWFIGLWSIVVYAPIAHWVWGSDGFLNAAGRARLCRRHGRAHQFRRRRPDVRAGAGQAARLSPPSRCRRTTSC